MALDLSGIPGAVHTTPAAQSTDMPDGPGRPEAQLSVPNTTACCRDLPSTAVPAIPLALSSPHPEIGWTTEPTINQHAQITDSIVWVIYG
jgi:hypothetical protein